MRTQIEKVFNLPNFFKTIKSSKNGIKADLKLPSEIVLQNIRKSWLQSIYAKTHQHYCVYLSENIAKSKSIRPNACYGYIDECLSRHISTIDVDLNSSSTDCLVKRDSHLKFSAVVPQQDVMQHFIQWQRYRKYWWSSITSTPGLFSVIDMKYESENTHANISANFKWGQWTVETIKVTPPNYTTSKSILCCTISWEKSLLTLLLDAMTDIMDGKEKYLRLHNKMAPYKISFALNYKDQSRASNLQELAKQIFHKLEARKISSWLPQFSLPLEAQIEENMQIGVTYTAILSEDTLSNGIFHLMNSSTTLKEQVHVADFVNYAAMLCGKQRISISN